MSELRSWKVDGIQCSFDDEDYVKSTWAFEACKLIHEVNAHLINIQNQSQKPQLLKLTRQRLKGLVEKLEFQLGQYQDLLKPLDWHRVDQNQFVSYLSQKPGSSELSINYDNLFRDWSWGDKENEVSVKLLQEVAGADFSASDCLVLGAGSGRLASDLFNQMKIEHMSLVDYNPFLLSCAKSIIAGETLELVELPMVPENSDSFAVKQKLSSAQPIHTGVDYLLADIRNLPYGEESFECVVTPWIVDVLQADFTETLAIINSLLPVGGTWLNFGPLGFNNPILEDYYSYEEVLFLIEKMGFKIKDHKYEMIPYLQSPYTNHHRIERVLALSAVKEKSVEVPWQKSRELYPWEQDLDSEIQIPVKEMNLVQGHEFNAYLYKLLEQPQSLNQLVAQVVGDKQIPEDQCLFMLRQILRNVQAMALKNPHS